MLIFQQNVVTIQLYNSKEPNEIIYVDTSFFNFDTPMNILFTCYITLLLKN
jgi:hypothetical protein